MQTVDQRQALLAELLPGQAKRDITTGQAEVMLATVRPRDIAGKTHRRIAADGHVRLERDPSQLSKILGKLVEQGRV